jgi:hypothetical protein
MRNHGSVFIVNKGATMRSLIFHFIIFATTSVLADSDLGRLTELFEESPGGFTFKGDSSIMYDSSVWNLKSNGTVKIYKDRKSPIAIHINETPDGSVRDVSYKNKYDSLFTKIWNAHTKDGKILSYTRCSTIGCFTVTKDFCQHLLKSSRAQNWQEFIDKAYNCHEISEAVTNSIFQKKLVMKQVQDEELRNKKALQDVHSIHAGRSLFFSEELSSTISLRVHSAGIICSKLPFGDLPPPVEKSTPSKGH